VGSRPRLDARRGGALSPAEEAGALAALDALIAARQAEDRAALEVDAAFAAEHDA
jgi:hypothetical protein